jgi:hypothetical protein
LAPALSNFPSLHGNTAFGRVCAARSTVFVRALLDLILAGLRAKRSRMIGIMRRSLDFARIPGRTGEPARPPVNLSGAPRDKLPDAKQKLR